MANSVIYTKAYDSEIEYLENSSNAVSLITTRIRPSTNYIYKWKYKILNLVDWGYTFNTAGTVGEWFIFGGVETLNKSQLHIKSDSNINGTPLQTNVLYECMLCKNGSNIEEYFNNVLYVSLPYQDFTASNYLRFLGSKIAVQLYYLQILDSDNNLIADFIPVRKGQTGCLYDKITGELFHNTGSGPFILGPDVPNPIPDVRYVLYDNSRRIIK